MFQESDSDDKMEFPYLKIISAFIRLSILALLTNFSLKLTNNIQWSYYVVLW